MAEYYSGKVLAVNFEGANSFFILKMMLDDSSHPINCRGYVGGITIKIGSWFGFEANTETHPKYGKQLSITKAPIFKNITTKVAQSLLEAEGLPSTLVRALASHFGEGLAKSLNSLDDLRSIPGMTPLQIEDIHNRWQRVVSYTQVVDKLGTLGVPPQKIKAVCNFFGEDVEKTLQEDPWALVQIPGITFQLADSIAQTLNYPTDCSPKRVRGAMLFALRQHRNAGHLYMSPSEMYTNLTNIFPDLTKVTFSEGVLSLKSIDGVVVDKTTKEGLTALYEPSVYKTESEGASLLLERLREAVFPVECGEYCAKVKDYLNDPEATGSLEDLLKKAVELWGTHTEIGLSSLQKIGVVNALLSPVSILTGLPGTGKTTSLKAAVSILQDMGVSFLLVAPTGIAAKRLSHVTGAPAYTIHRALLGNPNIKESDRTAAYTGISGSIDATEEEDYYDSDGNWEFGPGHYHTAEVVIVDESSMVDQRLLLRLLQGTSPKCRMVFVGDHAQLPSVGPGNVLRDLLHSKVFPSVSLTEIFRQKGDNDIVNAAHKIHGGVTPESSQDFTLVEVSNDDEAFEMVTKIAQGLFAKRKKFQVLSPKHNSVIGVTALNERLRELINPSSSSLAEHKIGSDMIREEDRVMVVKNDYDLGIFNGDLGKVTSINRDRGSLGIKIWDTGNIVNMPLKEAGKKIRLAYACTVHKSQGLEYDIIVMPITHSLYWQLQRNLLYTAVTRAKERVILVGSKSALSKAIANDKEAGRNTLFMERLQKCQS